MDDIPVVDVRRQRVAVRVEDGRTTVGQVDYFRIVQFPVGFVDVARVFNQEIGLSEPRHCPQNLVRRVRYCKCHLVNKLIWCVP